jgi:hypothetical protein
LNLLRQLLHRGCTHRFSWPRIDQNGHHYQICLSCGAAYEYDWKEMRRSKKLLAQSVQHAEMFSQTAYLRDSHGFASSK